ncbi:hypothetical protein SBY92_001204 [Candida maltosa Xu316]|uniref:TMEM205-like domain-containing protein n=1 Tax=Candida maltosa (strain Xu316) TaxID=1245528 RepID=M3IIC0_CANMX|nr:hypothetical protein G210_3692 [Candida maltosa Xu316]
MICSLGLNTRVPYHFLFYSLAFGGSAFYSFIVSPLVFKKLPREEFSNLQNKVFPTYFQGQIIAPVILALTQPLAFCPFTLGVLGISSIGGALNYFWLLPVCQKIKEQRNQLVADKADVGADGEPTEEFKTLSKQFGKYHGISTLVNMVSILSLAVYGVGLAKGLTKLTI